jgi:hypothetical protein
VLRKRALGRNSHGPLQRDGKRYAYQLTDRGVKVALLFASSTNSFAGR